MNKQKNHRGMWKFIAIAIVILLVAAGLYSILFAAPPRETSDPIPQSSPTVPSTPAPADPFSSTDSSTQSTDSQPMSDSVDPAYSYDQALSQADAQCQQSGYQPGTTAYDTCTEQAIQQLGH